MHTRQIVDTAGLDVIQDYYTGLMEAEEIEDSKARMDKLSSIDNAIAEHTQQNKVTAKSPPDVIDLTGSDDDSDDEGDVQVMQTQMETCRPRPGCTPW